MTLNSNHLFSRFSKFFAWLCSENQYNYQNIEGKNHFFVSFYKTIIFENAKAMRKIMLLLVLFKCAVAGAQNFNLPFLSESKPAIFGPGVISDGLPNRDMAISP